MGSDEIHLQKAVYQDVMVVGGREYPVSITKIIGHSMYDTPHGQVEADVYMEVDMGPKLGISRSYEIYSVVKAPDKSTADTKNV